MCFQALFPAALAFRGNIFIHFRVYFIFHLPTFHVFKAQGSWPDFIQGAPARFSGITVDSLSMNFCLDKRHHESIPGGLIYHFMLARQCALVTLLVRMIF